VGDQFYVNHLHINPQQAGHAIDFIQILTDSYYIIVFSQVIYGCDTIETIKTL
jgi:hypothetical protein